MLEALAMLVALPLWAKHWTSDRVSLAVESDNVATLTMVAKMQPHSAQMGIIARELALDICAAAHTPDIIRHIPGVANTAADALSRQTEPGNIKPIPAHLTPDRRTRCPTRNEDFWKTRQRP